MARKPLEGLRVLVVEDEYLVATEMVRVIRDLGGEPLGPVASVDQALALTAQSTMDGALLDVRLGERKTDIVAEAFAARGIPFILATGYDQAVLPDGLKGHEKLSKPIQPRELARLAARLFSRGP